MNKDDIKIEKMYCPFCGEEMNADIHIFDGVERPEYDHWICNSDGRLDCKAIKQTVWFDRDLIKFIELDGVY